MPFQKCRVDFMKHSMTIKQTHQHSYLSVSFLERSRENSVTDNVGY